MMMSIPDLPGSLHKADKPSSEMMDGESTAVEATMDTTFTTADTSTLSSPPPTPATKATVTPDPNTLDPMLRKQNQKQGAPNKRSHQQQVQKDRLRKPRNQRDQPAKAKAERSRDGRLPTTKSTSVFDRLYKTQTAASRAWAPVRQKTRKVKRVVGKDPTEEDLQVFHRLHISGTISTTTRRIPQKHPSRQKHVTRTSQTPSPAKAFTPTKQTKNGRMVYSPRMKPKTLLRCLSKYHPGVGFENVAPISLGYTFFQSFCEYENGALDGEELAKEIIRAFFKKDFPSGRHWTIDSPIVTEKEDPDALFAFDLKLNAKYDREGTVKNAVATAIVKCLPDRGEVRVEDYKCWVG